MLLEVTKIDLNLLSIGLFFLSFYPQKSIALTSHQGNIYIFVVEGTVTER